MNPLAGCMSNLWRREHNYAVSFADLDSASQSDSIGCGIESMWHKFLNCSLREYLPVTTGRYGSDSDGLASTVAVGGQTSVCSANSRASSTSIPRYLTVLSSFV